MFPRLFTLFDVAFPSYFVLLVTGFVLATAVGVLWAKRVGHDPDVVVDLGIGMLIFGVIGARLGHVLFDGMLEDYVHLCTDIDKVAWKITRGECLRIVEGDFLCEGGPVGRWDELSKVCRPLETDCWAWLRFWNGGLTYYGGFLGAVGAAFVQLRRDRFPFFRAADMAAMVIPLGLALGRLGCVLGGCCFGRPSTGFFSMSFPSRSPASEKQWQLGLLPSPNQESLPVFPTQLAESLAALGIAGILIFVGHPRKRYDGQLFLGFVVLYAVARFVLEFFRADDRGTFLGMSTSQGLGLALIAGALVANARLRRAKEA